MTCNVTLRDKSGLPVKKFIAANNRNDVFSKYLETGNYTPRSSVETIANAMDVGDPSNFARIIDLYKNSYEKISEMIKGYYFRDEEIKEIVKKVYRESMVHVELSL